MSVTQPQQHSNSNPLISSESTPLHRVVAFGASAGGLQAISTILAKLPANFPAPIVIVQHLSPHSPSQMADILSRRTSLRVKEAKEGDYLQAGTVYVAPPARHLMVRPDERLTFSDAEKVHHSRPAVDVLFSSLASSLRSRSIGVILTGGDGDGSSGIRAIRAAGGLTIAQDVSSSQEPSMPRNAVATGSVDFVVPLSQIAATLTALVAASPEASRPHSRAKFSSSESSLSPLLPPVSPPGNAASLKPEVSVPPQVSTLPRIAAVPGASVPPFRKVFNPEMVAEGTALERVQAAWQNAGQFSGSGAGPDEVSKLVTTALKEIDTCMEVLVVAEAALMDQNHALEHSHVLLREERLRYQALLNAVSSAALITDADGVIREANLAAAELLGVGLRHIVGRPLIRHIHQGERLDFPRRIQEAFGAGGWPSALRMRTRGDLAAVTASASAMRNSQGKCISLLWLMRASEAEVSEAEVSEAEVSEAEVSEAEVSEAEVTPQEDADYTNS